jgi:hypothetical protein
VAQFSFWGNYLRATRPICAAPARAAANIGGRMIGTSAALMTTQLTNVMPGNSASTQLAYAAAAVALLVYAVGFGAASGCRSRGKLPE